MLSKLIIKKFQSQQLDEIVCLIKQHGIHELPASKQDFAARQWVVVKTTIADYFKLLSQSNEVTNFTYHLTPLNLKHLAAFIAQSINVEYEMALKYITECMTDETMQAEFKNVVEKATQNYRLDTTFKIGRRVGWYAIIRLTKPTVVVESGVEAGIGAFVITQALMKNQNEGHEGHYYGLDLSQNMGELIPDAAKTRSTLIVGDSIETLRQFNKPIDIFISDSNHTVDFETKELETVNALLKEKSIVVTDNSHQTDVHLNFALKNKRSYFYWHEVPISRFFQVGAAGIGLSIKKE